MITVSNPKSKGTFAPETFPEVSENVISFLFELVKATKQDFKNWFNNSGYSLIMYCYNNIIAFGGFLFVNTSLAVIATYCP